VNRTGKAMRVDFVVPPLAALHHPALGVSSLTALAQERGWQSSVHYESLQFAALLGPYLYNWLTKYHNSRLMLGDFLFSLLRLPANERAARIARYLQEVISYYVSEDAIIQQHYQDFFLEWLDPLEAEAQAAVQRVLAHDPDILGFSVGAQQAGPALTLAYLLRQARPELSMWLGGQSCMGSIGYAFLKSFPWVDAVFTGYAEQSLLSALTRQAKGQSLMGIPGLLSREALKAGAICVPGDDVPELADLDEIPYPDFGDYFDTLRALPDNLEIQPILVMESSRGCWWGARHPCRFCGLNIHAQGFHSKAPERVLAEINELTRRYGITDIEMVDNVIDPRYFKTLLPQLAQTRRAGRIFYEIRSNLSRSQVALLKQAGVTEVQAGVEALEDELLKLLNKGITAFQNLQVLKWLEEEDILAHYNHLLAIPGETQDGYQRLLATMSLVHHLRPPNPIYIRLDRYSVYFEQPEIYGIKNIRPESVAFPHCFPEPQADIEGLNYHFAHSFLAAGAENKSWWRQVFQEIKQWHQDYYTGHKRLLARRLDGQVFIEDNRFSEEIKSFALAAAQEAVLTACESVTTIEAVMHRGQKRGFSGQALGQALQALEDLHLVVRHNDTLLGLVVFTDTWPYDFGRRSRKPFFFFRPNQVIMPYSQQTQWLMYNSMSYYHQKFGRYYSDGLYHQTDGPGGVYGQQPQSICGKQAQL
jgi:ribosomal peptide maturation radical SAM protein 1